MAPRVVIEVDDQEEADELAERIGEQYGLLTSVEN